MNDLSSVSDQKAQRQQLWIYLLPIVGIVPALWTLYRGQANEQEQKISRLSLILVSFWLIAYISLFFGSNQTSDLLSFRLLYINALITTGYFLACLLLLWQSLQGKSPYLPLLSTLANIKRKKKFP